MESDAELARQQLELARATSSRLWAEHRAFAETLDPGRGVVGPEELRRLREASEWTGKVYAAEHALFKAENGTPGIVGAHGEYQWLTMFRCDISNLLGLCPDVVLNKYLAVTSIDGGTLQLTDQDKRDGWWTSAAAKVFRGTSWGPREDRDDWKVAYSPRIDSIHGLPNEARDECCAGFDEWYVFDRPAAAGEIEAFVNWLDFRLYAPEWKRCADRFWEQMARLAPESYIADGTVFTFSTRNADLFAKVLSAFSSSAEQGSEETIALSTTAMDSSSRDSYASNHCVSQCVGVVDQAVENAIGQRRIADLLMRARDWQLRSQDRGAHLILSSQISQKSRRSGSDILGGPDFHRPVSKD